MSMEKILETIVAILVIGAIVGVILVGGTYNALVSSDVSAENAMAKVQSAYQRRADLIPSLVTTVEASANFERTTQVKIAEMRGQAAAIQQAMKNANSIQEMQQINNEQIGGDTGFLARFNLVVENYPQLTSTQNFRDLQVQLEGTENRIQYERNEYNDAVKSYKMTTRAFPTVIVAQMFGFSPDKWSMFESDAGSQNAPKIAFNVT